VKEATGVAWLNAKNNDRASADTAVSCLAGETRTIAIQPYPTPPPAYYTGNLTNTATNAYCPWTVGHQNTNTCSFKVTITGN
jgi:hypothetical protein